MPEYTQQQALNLPYVFSSNVVVYFEERVMRPAFLFVVMAFQTPFDSATHPFTQSCHADVHDIEFLLRRFWPFLVQNIEPTGLRENARPIATQLVF